MAVIKKSDIIEYESGESVFKKDALLNFNSSIHALNSTVNNKLICEYCGNHNKNENQTCYSCGANLK